MEKIFFAVLLIFLVSACFADNYSLKNSILSLSFEKGEKNNIYISDIKDEKSGIHFIKEPLKDKSLWQISVKDASDYAGPEILLTGKDAESVECEKSTGKIVIKYFNFGEVMRKVSLSDVPTKEIFWTQWNGTERVTLPLVRTGTFRYNGKTMICFTNVSEKETEFSWSGKAEDMGLKIKSAYRLTEIYPKKSFEPVSLNGCKGSLKIGPYETKLYIIE